MTEWSIRSVIHEARRLVGRGDLPTVRIDHIDVTYRDSERTRTDPTGPVVELLVTAAP